LIVRIGQYGLMSLSFGRHRFATKRSASRSVLLAATFLLAASPAEAWGTKGHRVVCELAWQETTDAGRAFAKQLLSVSDADGFAATCNWADTVRELPGFAWSEPHHFVEPPRAAPSFDVIKDCPDGGCAARAIGQQARIAVDTNEPPERRTQALAFVAHFVADIHQPLHAGFSDDRGGNIIAVEFCPRGCMRSIHNLHEVWDSGILAMSGPQKRLVGELERSLTDEERNDWKDDPVTAWAEEAHALAQSHAYHLVKNGRPDDRFIGDLAAPVTIKEGYLPVMAPVVKQQLKRAAVRLATALDALGRGRVPRTLTAVPPRFVEPSDGAVTVRARAAAASAGVAQLAAGDRAELLGIESAAKNTPKFFRVRLKDGAQGYVAQKGARVVAQ
jgi:hypothetical protein